MMMATPNKIITFIDSSVLINAIAGQNPARKMRAVAILGDQRREFIATRFLQLEVLPMPTRYQRSRELNFYQRFFSQVTHWLDEEPLIQPALDLACQHGLGGMDALHLAAAISLNAEFISAERPSKPFYQAYQNALTIY
jgi:predicted nucleic acid-binding protein